MPIELAPASDRADDPLRLDAGRGLLGAAISRGGQVQHLRLLGRHLLDLLRLTVGGVLLPVQDLEAGFLRNPLDLGGGVEARQPLHGQLQRRGRIPIV
jgi:hypothetical protein